MKGLSSLERIVLECLGKNTLTYEEIQTQSGLHENVCFNILQALIIRSIITTDGVRYRISENLSPLMLEEINGMEAKIAESLEMIEAVVENKAQRVFRFQKVAMDTRDEKIFLAMLSNLESFLIDAHKKAQSSVPLKERKVVFWGVGDVQSLMNQIVMGK
jgi:cyanate lyase